jgi:acetyl-CoA carboxylase alpha subunit
VIGEGGSEGALSLGVADRVLMMENAIYTVISPEGAAELMFQDKTRVEEAAESLKLTAQDCRDYGIIDRIIQEPPGGAHEDPDEASRQLRRILLQELADLQEVSKRKMLRSRYKKFREMGKYSSRFRTAVSRETSALKSFVGSGVKRLARRQPDLPEDDFDLSEE